MKIKSGYQFYGQAIGVLVFSTVSPRIPGDPGNNDSFNFPILYEIVKGGFKDLVEGNPQIKNSIMNAALNLKAKGVKAIIGDCGLMSLYQNEIGSVVGLPIAASSLCMIPSVWEFMGRDGMIGIITGHSELLSRKHLINSGWREEMPLVIQGMEEESHFAEIVINGGLELDVQKMESDVISATNKLLKKSKKLKAIIIECSNLGSYSRIIQEVAEMPVIDIISVTNFLEHIVNPKNYINKYKYV
jgi:hypothetical protein